MEKKFYEDPELIVFETVEDIVTTSGEPGAPDGGEVETENNDWSGGFVPF